MGPGDQKLHPPALSSWTRYCPAPIGMDSLTDFPLVLFAVTLLILCASVKAGAQYAERLGDFRDDFRLSATATLTLLGLIVGFTFSMALARYDKRRFCEEDEANSIGTEYARAELLRDRTAVRGLLREYLDQRILFYETRDRQALQRIRTNTAQLQNSLWESVRNASLLGPTPVTALAVSGMNDVVNSEGYTQAAWLNRIPPEEWTLLVFIAVCANLLVGLSVRPGRAMGRLVLILPLTISVSLLLIADIDAPRGGLIHIKPENLMSAAAALRYGSAACDPPKVLQEEISPESSPRLNH